MDRLRKTCTCKAGKQVQNQILDGGVYPVSFLRDQPVVLPHAPAEHIPQCIRDLALRKALFHIHRHLHGPQEIYG